ncbi:MAG: KH domain-containing protein [Bacilli bacterium]|jgi:R3H domain protein|nr:KH domain-containing protein [Bacilli bacterium]
MEKHRFVGKTYEEAVNKAKIELQELEENLIINVIDEKKSLLSKKCEIEVIEKREIKNFIKEKLVNILREMGYQAEVEIQVKQDIPTYRIYSNNDSLLIGKGGKNLEALQIVLRQIVNTETGINYKFFLDVSDYKEKNEHHLEVLARRLAREVATTKIEVKMDSMNSYERRIVHNVLTNNKKVYTESVGEEPNRCVVIKPRED